jgi:type IV pilus assembly protein PilW
MTQIKERGFTLISMMIGLTIGAFLLFGLYDIWAQMRRTFTAQDLSSNLQDNERMALAIIANTLQTAGYYPNYLNFQTPLPAGAPFSADSFTPDPGANPAPPPPFATRQSIAGTYSNAAPGDTLWVRFIADNNTWTASGRPTPEARW